jgi:hypothetical protein
MASLVRLIALGALTVLLTGTHAAADVSFGDQTGDHGMTTELTAPDITSVQVSNTRDGLITFRVAIENYDVLPPRSRIATLFDLDRNADTAELGFERAVSHRVDAAGTTRAVLERWDEANLLYIEIPATSISSSFSDGIYTLSISRSDLGNTAGFHFGLYAAAFGVNQRDRVLDSAPNENRWVYDLVSLPAPRLSATRFTRVPSQPVAGRAFTVATFVRRSDTGGSVTSGTVTCAVRIGQARARSTGGLSGGRARCVISVPRSAKGKILRGTMTVRAAGARLTRTFSYQVG